LLNMETSALDSNRWQRARIHSSKNENEKQHAYSRMHVNRTIKRSNAMHMIRSCPDAAAMSGATRAVNLAHVWLNAVSVSRIEWILFGHRARRPKSQPGKVGHDLLGGDYVRQRELVGGGHV
jgi:hypothetical protein